MIPDWTGLARELAERSRSQEAEAQYYWERHAPRYRYLDRLVRELDPPGAALDVGMGFQTLLLERLRPNERLDCLGIEEDHRYRPRVPTRFYSVNLSRLEAVNAALPLHPGGYGLIVCMEVIEHLLLPPERVLPYFAAQLAPGGILIVTTPNAAWLKNRLKLLRGRNPFERLSADGAHAGHIREYTRPELAEAFACTDLERVRLETRGLYRFDNLKDRTYSRIADWTLPSLRRTLCAVYRRRDALAPNAHCVSSKTALRPE